MKILNSMLLSAMLVLSACGKGGDGGAAAVPDPNAAAVAGTCAAGSVYTAQGCLPQGTCPPNYGWNNTTCVQGTMNGACAIGSVQTAQGCLIQGTCPGNYGWNGSTCVQGTMNGYYNGQQQFGNGQQYYNGQQQFGNGQQYNNGYYNGGYYNGGYNRYPYAGGGFYIGGRIGWGY